MSLVDKMLLKIVQAGEPVLRQRARELGKDEICSPTIQSLIRLMRETMRDAPGVGLAAPQVGVGVRVIVVEDRAAYQTALSAKELAARERVPVEFRVFINPKLTVEDPTPMEFYEACLSVGGYMATVPRARAVHIDALDEHGEPVSVSARGWYARILQHEVDHLDGILYVDRMLTKSLTTSDNYRRYKSS